MKGDSYILITEDNEVLRTAEDPTPLDLRICDDGCLTIIRLSDLHEYYNGKWSPIRFAVLDKLTDPDGPFHAIPQET